MTFSISRRLLGAIAAFATALALSGCGYNDFYYLAMLDKRIKAARDLGKSRAGPAADAAEAYMKETLRKIDLFKRETARLSPEQYDQFKATVAQHIAALGK